MRVWPQYVYITLLVIGFIVTVARHGEPRTGKHDASMALVALIVAVWLQWMGGFYDPILK